MGNNQDGHSNHPDGQQGDKTHDRFIDQLHEGRHEESREEKVARDREELALKGGRRLVEDREQHDEAEKNSEHTQLFAEHKLNRADGPSDNSGNLHGVIEHREGRADNKPPERKDDQTKE